MDEVLRSPQAVIRRCHALVATQALLEGVDPAAVESSLVRNGLTSELAGDEFEYVQAWVNRDAEAGDRLQAAMSWRSEALWTLLWALGAADSIEPHGVHGDNARVYESLAPKMQPEATEVDDLQLRSADQLTAARDSYRVLANADPLPDGILPLVVAERLHALEWLFQDVPWDEVELAPDAA